MFGIEQIKSFNKKPKAYAEASLSDGQARRENSGGKAYWSENIATMQVRKQSKLTAMNMQLQLPVQYFTALRLFEHHDGHANALATGLRLARIAETEEQMREAANFLDGVFKRIEISRQSAT